MEVYVDKKKQNALLIRRFAAILLTALAVLSMFLPMLGLNGEVRDMFRQIKKDSGKSVKRVITEDLPGEYMNDLIPADDRYLYRDYYEFMNERVQSIAKKVVVPAYEKIEDNSLTLMEMCSASGLPSKAVSILTKKINDLEEIMDGYVEDGSVSRVKADAFIDDFYKIKSFKTLADIAGVVPYVLFFIMLVCGVAAAVMYFLNRGKLFGVLFAVFAVLCALMLIGAIVVPKILLEDTSSVTESMSGSIKDIISKVLEVAKGFVPGAGLIMMPVFALAAVIVYKRDKSYTGIFPKREKTRKPIVEDGPGSGPIADAYGWVCPRCGFKNDNDSNFCCGCGASKAAHVQPETAEPVKYCSSCGAKQDPDAKFCLNCGTKIE